MDRPLRPEPRERDRPKPAAPLRVSSRLLFAGHREVIIEHDEAEYRLRVTASNKLILVK